MFVECTYTRPIRSENKEEQTYIHNRSGSPGDVSEEPVTQEKRKKGWRMNCDIREATERLENEL